MYTYILTTFGNAENVAVIQFENQQELVQKIIKVITFRHGKEDVSLVYIDQSKELNSEEEFEALVVLNNGFEIFEEFLLEETIIY